MSEMIDLLLVEPGRKFVLNNGAVVETIQNPMDGMWLFCRYVSHPSDAALVGEAEHAIFGPDIREELKPQ